MSGLPVGGIQLIVEGLLHQLDVCLVPVRVNVRVGSSFLELRVLFTKIKEFTVGVPGGSGATTNPPRRFTTTVASRPPLRRSGFSVETSGRSSEIET